MNLVLCSYLRGSLKPYYRYIAEVTPREELSRLFKEYMAMNRRRENYSAQEMKLRECNTLMDKKIKGNVFDSSPTPKELDRLLRDDIRNSTNVSPYTTVIQHSYHPIIGVSWCHNDNDFYFNPTPIEGVSRIYNETYYRYIFHLGDSTNIATGRNRILISSRCMWRVMKGNEEYYSKDDHTTCIVNVHFHFILSLYDLKNDVIPVDDKTFE